MSKRSLSQVDYMGPTDAAKFYGLNPNKLRKALAEGDHDFIVYYGNRKLLLRELFEEYLARPGVKEGLEIGKKRQKAKGVEDRRVDQG